VTYPVEKNTRENFFFLKSLTVMGDLLGWKNIQRKGLIVMGGLPRWKNKKKGLIVMGCPRKKNTKKGSHCNE
jgi:hypothetical protein